MNKAEREGKAHRAAGKSKGSGKYNKLFPSEQEKRNKTDFDNAWNDEDIRRSKKSKK